MEPGDIMKDNALGRVLRNAATQLGGQTFNACLSIAYLAMATRALGLAEFGRFSMTIAIAQTVSTIIVFQSSQIVSRYGVSHDHSGDERRLSDLLWFCAGLDAAGGAASCILSSLVCIAVTHAAGWPVRHALAACTYCAVVSLSVRSTPVGLLRIKRRYPLAAGCEALSPIIRTVGAVTTWLAPGGFPMLLVFWCVGDWAVTAAYWCAASRHGAPWRRLTRPSIGDAHAANPGLWRYALATNAMSSLKTAGKGIGILVVGVAAGEAAAGAYRICLQICFAISRCSQNISRAALPEFSLSRMTGTDDLRSMVFATTVISLIAAAVVAVALPWGAPLLLAGIAGTSYAAAAPTLAVLTGAALLEVVGTAFEPALLALDRAGQTLRSGTAGTAVTLTLLWPASSAWGDFGASCAALAGAVASVGSAGYFTARALARPTNAPVLAEAA